MAKAKRKKKTTTKKVVKKAGKAKVKSKTKTQSKAKKVSKKLKPKKSTQKTKPKAKAKKKVAPAKKTLVTDSSPSQHPLIGQPIPQMTLQNQRGEFVNLEELVKSTPKLVLYFYPKDDTPGCTTEACGFRDNFSRIQSMGVTVVGVSPDDILSHQKFIEKYHLNFDLISDTDHRLCEAFGIWKEKSFMGRTYLGVERSTFVFHNGNMIYGWQPVKVDGHVDAVISKLAELL